MKLKTRVVKAERVDGAWLWLEIGKRFKTQREKSGKTQQDTAAALRISRTSVTNTEAGRQRLTLEFIVDAALFFGCDPAELFPW